MYTLTLLTLEQVEIIEFIQQEETRFDRLLSAYACQLTLLSEYRAALIHEGVTGQRPVPDCHAQAEEIAHAL